MSESDNQLSGNSSSGIIQTLGETALNLLRTLLLWLLDEDLTLKSKNTGECEYTFQEELIEKVKFILVNSTVI